MGGIVQRQNKDIFIVCYTILSAEFPLEKATQSNLNNLSKGMSRKADKPICWGSVIHVHD